mmetsp:Transcript_120398/g.341111  ORF Transcript_120398/g.341111 Transcript_120398/m.341111 type:complete len:323 (-) Transcript_120398:163-1131(-)
MASLVDTVTGCQEAVACLFQEAELAVDIEGVSLGRLGEDCIVQIYAPSADAVYLFDITVLGDRAYEEGGLRKLLEDDQILKIFFDVRSDSDALFHLHRVKARAIYDLQILYDVRFSSPVDRKLVGLKRAMQEYFAASKALSPREVREMEDIKDTGQALFAPSLGGSYEVWKLRPLARELVVYSAVDVKYLCQMKRYWGTFGGDADRSSALDDFVVRSSMERAERFVGLPDASALDQESKKCRDFEIPDGFNTSGKITESVPVPSSKRGLVIGRKGATIKAIEASSGARASFDDASGSCIVSGSSAQVAAAVREIRAKMAEGR